MKKWRWAVWAAIGVVVIAAALVYRHYWFARPIGEGPAGPLVPGEPFQEVWSERSVLLVGIGDSVTAGFGATEGNSYFQRLIQNPQNEFPEMQGLCLSAVLPNLRTDNLAVSGSTSLEHVEWIRDRLDVQDPKTFGLVVMTTGGNDIIHMYGRLPPREGAMYGATLLQAEPWIENFGKRLNEMLDLVESRFPGGCRIFLADIYDPTDGLGDAQTAGLPKWADGLAIHRAYNDLIHGCARQRECVHLVPMHQAFLGHGIHCAQPWREHYCPEDPHYWYGDNLEDPNDRGYDALRRLFLLELSKATDAFDAPIPETPDTPGDC